MSAVDIASYLENANLQCFILFKYLFNNYCFKAVCYYTCFKYCVYCFRYMSEENANLLA